MCNSLPSILAITALKKNYCNSIGSFLLLRKSFTVILPSSRGQSGSGLRFEVTADLQQLFWKNKCACGASACVFVLIECTLHHFETRLSGRGLARGTLSSDNNRLEDRLLPSDHPPPQCTQMFQPRHTWRTLMLLWEALGRLLMTESYLLFTLGFLCLHLTLFTPLSSSARVNMREKNKTQLCTFFQFLRE